MFLGYDAGVLGGVLLHQPFLDAIGNPTGEWTIALISSSYSLAACVTTVVVAPFTFRLGRRGTILLGNGAAIVGSVVQATSYSMGQLIAGRIITVSESSLKYKTDKSRALQLVVFLQLYQHICQKLEWRLVIVVQQMPSMQYY